MKRKPWMPAVLLATLAARASAEDVYLKRPVDLRSDGNSAANVVAPAKKGDKAVVVERNGNWVRVNLNGKEGWVGADSLSARPVKADTMLFGGNGSVESSSGAAGKGLEPITEDYGRARNLSRAGVDEMVAIRKSITGAQLKSFVTEGNIESPKKAARPATPVGTPAAAPTAPKPAQ